jgi:hypothetical protein
VSSYYSFPTLPERTSEDFEVVSPVRAEDNAYSALDRLVQAAGLEQATRPQSPQVPVEQLSPLTLAPVPQPLTLVSSPTAPPSALFPPEPSLVDSPINYERVASQPSPFQYPTPLAPPSPRTPTSSTCVLSPPSLPLLRPRQRVRPHPRTTTQTKRTAPLKQAHSKTPRAPAFASLVATPTST